MFGCPDSGYWTLRYKRYLTTAAHVGFRRLRRARSTNATSAIWSGSQDETVRLQLGVLAHSSTKGRSLNDARLEKAAVADVVETALPNAHNGGGASVRRPSRG
jgi:hypothetical protein